MDLSLEFVCEVPGLGVYVNNWQTGLQTTLK